MNLFKIAPTNRRCRSFEMLSAFLALVFLAAVGLVSLGPVEAAQPVSTAGSWTGKWIDAKGNPGTAKFDVARSGDVFGTAYNQNAPAVLTLLGRISEQSHTLQLSEYSNGLLVAQLSGQYEIDQRDVGLLQITCNGQGGLQSFTMTRKGDPYLYYEIGKGFAFLFASWASIAAIFGETIKRRRVSGRTVRRLTAVGWIVFAALFLSLLGGSIVQYQEGVLKLEDDKEQQDQLIRQEVYSEQADKQLRATVAASQDAERLSSDAKLQLRDALVTLRKSVIQGQQTEISVWREQRPFGEISGIISLSIDLKHDQPPAALSGWIERVGTKYRELKSRSTETPPSGDQAVEEIHEWRNFDSIDVTFGPPLSDLGKKRPFQSLLPTGQKESLADEILFHSKYALFVAHNRSVDPDEPTMNFDTKSGRVSVLFDRGSMQPTAIESTHSLTGKYNPTSGEITSWIDLYGADLTFCDDSFPSDNFTAYQLHNYPILLQNVKFGTVEFESRGPYLRSKFYIGPLLGNPSASISDYAQSNSDGCVKIRSADWRTLGPVPGDYPGKRLPAYGAVPEAQ